MTATALKLYDYHPTDDDLENEILEGLRDRPKHLPPKYFYDRRGSQLFDAITELPEYYPTRTETAIMERCVDDIARRVGPGASLIEFGSGSSTKTHILLERLPQLAAYVPVEISRKHLVEAAEAIAGRYPHIEVLPVCADFTQAFELPRPKVMPERNLVFFPGSTIGNFYPGEAQRLLTVMGRIAKRGGALLIGVDLKKDRATLERAYNDDAEITAQFNLNMLARLNREMDADFDLDAFEHRAVYNPDKGRIEMHLVSQVPQSASVTGERFDFDRDEYILTECSHKYTLSEFAALAAPAGFEVEKVWTDDAELFSVQLLVCRDPASL